MVTGKGYKPDSAGVWVNFSDRAISSGGVETVRLLLVNCCDSRNSFLLR
ncbi:MAG: hypothetical protein SXA11_18160 [Cyanobacteriota bacterium]|nr:hypothetical protein [Cyanobacteriota bacterium]